VTIVRDPGFQLVSN